ncbi:GNAT family N-acetyltransferase [Vibrio sp. 1262-1]|uniref:GNAT family N-acetyltransferase n=1 Tax=Vibrio sp. 1262-1 TaxID=3074548 RepID=UPI0029641227|nr:GNAT family N-acetyltransferase [Vibrio sp. 1262-1]MDW2402507.1 GNAT family N-acetyltransferase [Vibrio sp. 1262-1]
MDIRKAEKCDLMVLFDWANSKLVRENSFSKNEISINEHRDWFFKKLEDSNSYIYLGVEEGTLIGQVRFDRKNSSAVYEIDIHISPRFHGNGFGNTLLKLAINRFAKDCDSVKTIESVIFSDNKASQRCFEKNDFTFIQELTINEIKCRLYNYQFTD